MEAEADITSFLQREIINALREALLGVEYVKGFCPECGEPNQHYRKCKIKLALEASSRFKPKRIEK